MRGVSGYRQCGFSFSLRQYVMLCYVMLVDTAVASFQGRAQGRSSDAVCRTFSCSAVLYCAVQCAYVVQNAHDADAPAVECICQLPHKRQTHPLKVIVDCSWNGLLGDCRLINGWTGLWVSCGVRVVTGDFSYDIGTF